MQDQLLEQFLAILQEKCGLNADQAQQVIQTGMTFAQEHSGEIIQTYGPQILQNFGPEIASNLGPQIGQLLGNNPGGLLGGLFGGGR